MQIYAVSGKGGVGKTTVSSSLALAFANNGIPTLLIDCDKQGKAISRTFSPEGKLTIPSEHGAMFSLEKNLYGGAIMDYTFKSLPSADSSDARESGIPRDEQFRRYMRQFPGEYGIGAYQDMMSTFFGVSSNPKESLDFVTLTKLISGAKDKGIERIVLDLEPTKGSARLLNTVNNSVRALKNMSGYGFVTLKMIASKYPDITRFLESKYIEGGEMYGDRMKMTARRLRNSRYILVCGPEAAKVDEMVDDTEKIIRSFSGEIGGYVINDIRIGKGIESDSQKRQIERVEDAASMKGIKVAKINHNPQICIDQIKDSERREVLNEIGEKLSSELEIDLDAVQIS